MAKTGLECAGEALDKTNGNVEEAADLLERGSEQESQVQEAILPIEREFRLRVAKLIQETADARRGGG